MGAINGQGVYEYDDTEPFAPLRDYSNLQAAAITAAIAAVRAEIAAIDSLVDSAWTLITTFGAGWGATPNYAPRVRKVGDRVELAGAVTATGAASFDDIFTIPLGFRFEGAYTTAFVGTYRANSGATGEFHISTGAGAAHKLTSPAAYRTGSLAVGQIVPVHGSWFIN